MTTVIVPNALRNAINKKLDEAYNAMSENEREAAQIDRELHYQTLLNWYDEHGTIPQSISLVKKPE